MGSDNKPTQRDSRTTALRRMKKVLIDVAEKQKKQGKEKILLRAGFIANRINRTRSYLYHHATDYYFPEEFESIEYLRHKNGAKRGYLIQVDKFLEEARDHNVE